MIKKNTNEKTIEEILGYGLNKNEEQPLERRNIQESFIETNDESKNEIPP